MNFLNFNHILCLSPHPDDVEYGMAGTIMKFPKTKFDILCLGCGGDFDKSTNPLRLNEVNKFWAKSKCKNVTIHNSPHSMIKDIDVDAWINFIEMNYVNCHPYDAIFIPPHDDSHFEHQIVSTFGLALTRHKPISVIEYCTPSTLEHWIANLYVDITQTYILKLKLMKFFQSQQNKAYFSKETMEYFHFHYQLAKRGIHRVERYRTLHHVVT
jgi:LmbE family N-acetylglucosaminyl deacetylase